MYRMKLNSIVIFLLGVVFFCPDTYSGIVVMNSSFESNTNLPFNDEGNAGGAYDYSIDHWEIVVPDFPVGFSNGGTWRPANTDWLTPLATEGRNVAFLNNEGFIRQELSSKFSADVPLELKVDIGWRYDYDIFKPDFSIQILAGGEILATNSDQSVLRSGGWGTSTVSYLFNESHRHLVGQSLELRFYKFNTGQINFDNVRLNSVPEPSTISLVFIGFCLGMIRLFAIVKCSLCTRGILRAGLYILVASSSQKLSEGYGRRRIPYMFNRL